MSNSFTTIDPKPITKAQLRKLAKQGGSLKSGTSHTVYDGLQVILIFYGRPVYFLKDYFMENPSLLRDRVEIEAQNLRTGISDWYNWYSKLYDDHPVTARISHWFSFNQLPSLDPLKDLIDEVDEVIFELRNSSPIKADVLAETGLELMALRLKEKEAIAILSNKLEASQTGAGYAIASLELSRDISFGILKAGNKLYSFGNPIREAMGELTIITLEGAGTVGGVALSGGDTDAVLRALKKFALNKYPPALVGIMMGVLNKSLKANKLVSGDRVRKSIVILIRVIITFTLDLLIQAIKDEKKITGDWLLKKSFDLFRVAIFDLTGVLLGFKDDGVANEFIEKKRKAWTLFTVAAIMESISDVYFEAKKQAKKEKRPVDEVFLANWPAMIVRIVEVFLSKFLEVLIEDKINDKKFIDKYGSEQGFWGNAEHEKKAFMYQDLFGDGPAERMKAAVKIKTPLRDVVGAAPLKETDMSVGPVCPDIWNLTGQDICSGDSGMTYLEDTAADTDLSRGNVDNVGAARYRRKTQNTYDNYVSDLQKDLYTLGFTSVGEADGVFGKKTEVAVKSFQHAASTPDRLINGNPYSVDVTYQGGGTAGVVSRIEKEEILVWHNNSYQFFSGGDRFA